MEEDSIEQFYDELERREGMTRIVISKCANCEREGGYHTDECKFNNRDSGSTSGNVSIHQNRTVKEMLALKERCPACIAKRLHSDEEYKKWHPLGGQGFDGNFGLSSNWTSKEAKEAHEIEQAELVARVKQGGQHGAK